jgi:Skp family chaperone for outer membrane proteins
LTREIYGKIEAAARRYGAEQGFTAIVVKNELLYLGENVDVTDVTDSLIGYVDTPR